MCHVGCNRITIGLFIEKVSKVYMTLVIIKGNRVLWRAVAKLLRKTYVFRFLKIYKFSNVQMSCFLLICCPFLYRLNLIPHFNRNL